MAARLVAHMILDASPADLDPVCWQRRTTGRRGDDPAGVQLQRLRHKAGVSLHEVGDALGITPHAVSRWEAGHGSPSPRHRRALAQPYRVAEVPLPARVRARETGQQVTSPMPVVQPAPPRIDGARLRAARQAQGWTQADLAERVGVSAAAICRWESHSRAALGQVGAPDRRARPRHGGAGLSVGGTVGPYVSHDQRVAPSLAPDLAGAVAQAGVNPSLEDRVLQDALRSVIATARGSCDWTVDPAGR